MLSSPVPRQGEADALVSSHPGSNSMKRHISENFSTKLINWNSFLIMGNTLPPRDPEEDEEEDDEEDEEDEEDDEEEEADKEDEADKEGEADKRKKTTLTNRRS
jgi:hypothetical protein